MNLKIYIYISISCLDISCGAGIVTNGPLIFPWMCLDILGGAGILCHQMKLAYGLVETWNRGNPTKGERSPNEYWWIQPN